MAAVLIAPVTVAQAPLEPIIVTASKVETEDTAATYASEVYGSDDIASSGADSLYDFLNQNTSIAIMPSYGNPYSQLIDVRGYGIGDGYQNVVITVDGRRMNNVDMVPQLLSSISLNNIGRIEITKGSGSVIYGDGATAGSIQIYTKDATTTNISLEFGNHGAERASFSTGLSEEFFTFSVSADDSSHDGFSVADTAGNHDNSDNNNSRIMLRLFPTDSLELSLGRDHSKINTRYVGSLTESEFNSDPSQNGGNAYTPQEFKTDVTTIGLITSLTDNIELSINHSIEDKYSNYLNGWGRADYDYKSSEASINYEQDMVRIIAGMQQFAGDRIKIGSNTTTKNNAGYFVHGEYGTDNITISLGGRKEDVDYTYAPVTGTALNDNHKFSSYDIGINSRINENLSIFSNYNSAFQAPDIDRFFNWGGTFNSFISPAKSKTLNIGLNHTTVSDKTKLTAFHSDLTDEIYYYKSGWSNTNIDKSHKYGLELQNHHKFTDQLNGSLNYAYTRAIIDSENEASGAYNGKDLPGVSKHNLTLGVRYSPTSRSRIVASHNYRSSAYAAEDFSNSAAQKQKAYNSTNISYTYTRDNLEFSAGIDNLFENSNGIWVRDNAIYPVNFTRNWKAGVKLTF